MGIQVSFQFLLTLWVSFDSLYSTVTNCACLLSDHGIIRNVFSSIDKYYFITFFFCTLTSTWIDDTNIIDLLPLLLLLVLFWFYARVYGDRECSPMSLDATGIRVLPPNFRISSPFSSLVPTVRQLFSFLL